ncbi:P-loop NTPase fold protein [Marinimicrobium sp. C2-29]|uniref:P-loop NTPase fold protein n=1 Tax=Marinimicrobium sp. C2-29 TaxID=3139825 RepID=UPI00313A31FA
MKRWNIDTALSKFRRVFTNTYANEDLSESDTRSKLIDYILLECLGWNEADISREERCNETGRYLDYKLSTNMPIMIIEAKKVAVDFELPRSSTQRSFKVGGVLSSCKTLVAAMMQAKDYAVSKGISFCAVTNGRQFIFFRAQNQHGIPWSEHKVLIFRSLEDIESNFDEFCRILSKNSVESGTLQKSLPISDSAEDDASQFQTLDVRHLNRPRQIDRNPLYPFIGDIIHRVFQDLASENAESEILEHCYVDSPQKPDKRQPYIDRSTRRLKVSKKDAGDFQQRVVSALKAGETGHAEVILLIGSVGVGKSTFIQRFRKVLVRNEINESGIWIYLDFKNYSDTGETLDSFISGEIDETLTEEYSELGLNDWQFLKQAYHADYEKLKKGALSPLFQKDPDGFELKFGEKIDEWSSSDRGKHCTKILTTASKRLQRSIFLVFDNADQLNPETQNKIFLAAQKLTNTIGCYALIAMREESYWKNRDAGPLDAFHNTAYHVQPPSLDQVLSKRFSYAKSLILSERFSVYSDFEVSEKELAAVFDRLVQTLLGEDRSYINFIEATSARDTRRALDNVAAFMVSGHTNIEAILRDERKSNPIGFPVPFHEFLNAIILRDHQVFSEDDCDTINIFNVTGTSDASNFNRIAVLGRILSSKNSKSEIGTGYVLIEQVVNDCYSAGILPETTISIITTLNSRRLIETETTIKSDISQSKYLRATKAGSYYIEDLCKMFGYLDLVVYGTPICREKSFNKLNKIYQDINRISENTSAARLQRVQKRLELVEAFVEYLFHENQKCAFSSQPELFSPEATGLVDDMRKRFSIEKQAVMERARNIFDRKPSQKTS